MRRYLRVNMSFSWGYGKHNSHGTQAPGKPWNHQPITWSIRRWPLDIAKPGHGNRYAFYGPGGKWFHFDVVHHGDSRL